MLSTPSLSAEAASGSTGPSDASRLFPALAAVAAYAVLFWEPLRMLVWDWLHNPDAGYGLLLAPLALVLAYRRGRAPQAAPQPRLGLAILVAAVLLRYVSGIAAEWFTMRFSALLAAVGIIVFLLGLRQVRHWWLPLALLALSIPLPAVVLGSLALPLQFQASAMGAAMMRWRHVPVLLQGNVIHLPGRALFVTEACSGLRSLTALLSLGLLIGGLWLRSPVLRALLVLLAIPVAMVLNGIRIFLTGFLVYYVSPELGEGVMHYTEGMAIFVAAFAILGAIAFAMVQLERAWRTP